MSTLIRLPGVSQKPGYYETVVSTETVVETVRVCQQEPVLNIVVIYVAGTPAAETITVPGPVDYDFAESQPPGTTIIFVEDTGLTQEVCHEEEITKEVTYTDQVYHEGGLQYSFELGWTAGADSSIQLEGNGRFKFSILDTSIGVFCGLSPNSSSVLPNEIKYAFYCTSKTYTTIPNLVTGTFTSDTVFYIERSGSVLSWVVNGIIIDTLVVDGLPNGLFADASLYATDDAIIDAEFIIENIYNLIEVIEGFAVGILPSLYSSSISAYNAGIGILPALTESSTGLITLPATSSNTLPLLESQGISGFTSFGSCNLPALTEEATGVLPLLATANGILHALTSIGHVGSNAFSHNVLPSLTGLAYTLLKPEVVIGWGALPALSGYSHGNSTYNLTVIGVGVLPELQSFATENFAGYGSGSLPALTGRGYVKLNSAYFLLGTFLGSGHGGIENWKGYCFYDPIYLEFINGLKGTWLTNSEKRIETYFGLTGSNSRTLTVQRNYTNVSGVLAYVATYYQDGIPDRFDLVTDLLDFVKPSKTSAGWEIDRILAHELTHAVMNDRIDTTSWPGWFSEGLCEFIHGAAERVRQHLSTESIASLLSALTDDVSGHSSMTSRHYAAGYLAVWKLHSATTGGIKTLILDMVTGTSLNATIINNTTFGSVADFLTWMTGSDGVLFVQQLYNQNAFSQADTGAIGGYVVDGGPVLDNFSVIPD